MNTIYTQVENLTGYTALTLANMKATKDTHPFLLTIKRMATKETLFTDNYTFAGVSVNGKTFYCCDDLTDCILTDVNQNETFDTAIVWLTDKYDIPLVTFER